MLSLPNMDELNANLENIQSDDRHNLFFSPLDPLSLYFVHVYIFAHL